MKLSRYPILRFDGIQAVHSLDIINDSTIGRVKKIIHGIQDENPDVMPGDIAIIYIDDSKDIYTYMDELCNAINKEFGFLVNRGYETKSATEDSVYITNANNVKGLEFPFVICITKKILSHYRYRNSLYTMLTRSFIKSYLLVTSDDGLDVFRQGIQYINQNNCIRTHIPTDEQQKKINKQIVELQTDQVESFQEILEDVFDELGIKDVRKQTQLTKALETTKIDKFDKAVIKKFIEMNLSFYS